MHCTKVIQDGNCFDAKVLSLSTEKILAKFQNAVSTQASLSLGAGYATSASAPHTLLNGFKNLLAASIASDFSFPQAEAFLSAAKNAPAAGAATATAAEAAAPVEEEKKEEPEDVDMGNLFGGDDEDDY